jgi:hypothetical protein
MEISKIQNTLSLIAEDKKLELAVFESGLTLKQAAAAPMIKHLEIPMMDLVAKISMILIRCSQSFNLSKPLTQEQSVLIACDLIDENCFGSESLEDLILMLKMVRKGQLGEVYNRLDSQVLIGQMLPKYLELKAEMREKEHLKSKEQHKNDLDSITDYSKKILELTNKLATNASNARDERSKIGFEKANEFRKQLDIFRNQDKKRIEHSRNWIFEKDGDFEAYMKSYDSKVSESNPTENQAI